MKTMMVKMIMKYDEFIIKVVILQVKKRNTHTHTHTHTHTLCVVSCL